MENRRSRTVPSGPAPSSNLYSLSSSSLPSYPFVSRRGSIRLPVSQDQIQGDAEPWRVPLRVGGDVAGQLGGVDPLPVGDLRGVRVGLAVEPAEQDVVEL